MQFASGYLLGGLTVAGLAVSFGLGMLASADLLAKANKAKNEKAEEIAQKNAEDYLMDALTKFMKK